MNVETGTLKPGEARCPAETTQEIIARDKHAAPAWAASESYEYLGSEDVTKERYTSAEFAKGEFDRLWTRAWQMACREEHIPDVGDYYVDGKPRPLVAGMVLTIEPGLYVAADDEAAPKEMRGVGIRIEDDVLVTPEGRDNLTQAVPKEVADLEAVCTR